jgi:hypothetical protein
LSWFVIPVVRRVNRRTHNSTEKIRIEGETREIKGNQGKTRENDRITRIWKEGIDAGENL